MMAEVRSFYVENPNTETMHLTAMGWAQITRCGQVIGEDWIDYDDTDAQWNGLKATCKRCLRAAARLATP
jgi:hypothetical protein